MRRWITLAVLAWLSLMLAGREHALAAFGLELACLHPGDTPRAHHAEPHEEGAASADHDDALRAPPGSSTPDHDATASDGAGDEDCPPGCTDCACGAAPCAPSTPLGVAARGWTAGLFEVSTTRAGPTQDRVALDRPPRRG